MHLVAGMDAVPELRGILCLFEGVATGAGRRVRPDDGAAGLDAAAPGTGCWPTGSPTCTTPPRRHADGELVGDHATYHKRLDAPLESDIDALAGTFSRWVHRTVDAGTAGPDTASAIAAAGTSRYRQGGIATLILPADACWSDGGVPARRGGTAEDVVHTEAVEQAAKALGSGEPCLILLGSDTLRREGRRRPAASRTPPVRGCWPRTRRPGRNAVPASRTSSGWRTSARWRRRSWPTCGT
jgi:acetolactate synthase-1/2/3 large subunit